MITEIISRVKRMMKNCWILKVQQKQQRQSLSNHWQTSPLMTVSHSRRQKQETLKTLTSWETFKRRPVNFFYIIWNDIHFQRITVLFGLICFVSSHFTVCNNELNFFFWFKGNFPVKFV